MFLFDSDYFISRIVLPGGLSDYLSEFLVQFYYIPVIGAVILSLLYVLIQRLIWVVSKVFCNKNDWYPLSFIPSILLWFYMGDENVMLSFVISVIMALLSMYMYSILNRKVEVCNSILPKYIFIFVYLPLFYFLFGVSMYILSLYIIIAEIRDNRSFDSLLFSSVTAIYTIAIILFSSVFYQYSLYNLFGGINYYRYPSITPIMQLIIMLAVAIVPLAIAMLPKVRHKVILILTSCVFLSLSTFFFVRLGFDSLKYELIDYDYLVRTSQWQKIINKAEKKQAETPMGVACVNLALAKTGQLSDRLFEFYQNGSDGLFPAFERDMTSPVSTSEVFYNLGMINDAQRYIFEAQEAIPNFRKSGRFTKRLAETNLINGQYNVASKYLRMLHKTLFYRSWANSVADMIGDEKQINSDPEYGKLRKYRQKKKDYLFSDSEIDQMLGMLYVENYDNRLAFEYLICYELLQGNMELFKKYYPLGRYAKFDHIPRAYQEALVYEWALAHPSFSGIPWSIDSQTCNDMASFASTYAMDHNAPSLREGTLGNTLWSYLLVKNKKTDNLKQNTKPVY